MLIGRLLVAVYNHDEWIFGRGGAVLWFVRLTLAAQEKTLPVLPVPPQGGWGRVVLSPEAAVENP